MQLDRSQISNTQAEQHTHPFVDDAFFIPHVPDLPPLRPSSRYTSRSEAFCIAHDAFHTIRESVHEGTLDSYQTYGKIEAIFSRWLKRYENSFIKIYNEAEKRLVLSRCSCRFMESYKSRLWKRYGFLESIKWDLMLSLTVDPQAFDRLSEEFAGIIRGWDKLRSAIRREYGDFVFVRVLEIQKSGRPHLHILISGIQYIPKGWIMELWSCYKIGLQIHIGAVRRRDLRGLSYVMKYVKKTTRTFGKDLLYSSLLFASNRRQWGFSFHRRLASAANLDNTPRVIRTEKSGLWKFEGFASVRETICFCCRAQVPFNQDVMFMREVDRTYLEGLG
jgi:hypothetical protein